MSDDTPDVLLDSLWDGLANNYCENGWSIGALLVTDLTSALDDKSIGIEYCQKKYMKNHRRYPYRYCIWKVSQILASLPLPTGRTACCPALRP